MSELFADYPQQDGGSRRDRQGPGTGRKSLVSLLVGAFLVGGAAYVVLAVVGNPFSGGSSTSAASKEDFEGPGVGEVMVVVDAGDSGSAIAQKLVKAGVVATVKAATAAYKANPEAVSIQPGTYRLKSQMSAKDAIAALLDPTLRQTIKLTIQEGYRVDQIVAKISSVVGTITVDQLNAVLADPAQYGLPAEANGNPEGWLFPETYSVDASSTAASILSQMTAQTVAVLNELAVPQDRWEDVLIRASLVEREGKTDEDRAKMAQTIQNRLDDGMILQIDASLAYGLNKNGTGLTEADKTSDSPYNLYKVQGLPPTPIASPGRSSINAVMHPTPGKWMYWTAVNLDTGETRFAETYAEHQANVALLREWQAAHPNS